MNPRPYIAIAFFCSALTVVFSGHLHAEEDSKKVLVHYLPWFSSKPVSGYWGWHWTMNHFDPDRVGRDGQREIASHTYPLMAPYDSNDPRVLECQVLLMKLAGIKGVVIDWYGLEQFRDYSEIHRNTQHLIKYLKMAGLQYAVCYEDQAVKHMVEGGFLPQQDAVAHGKMTLDWLDENWFGDETYVKMDGRPALFVFGPQYFEKEEWGRLVAGLNHQPLLFGLLHLSQAAGAAGVFGWPPVAGGQRVAAAAWRKYLDDLYARDPVEAVVGVVFPGFHDIYKEAGVGESYGFIDDQEGSTFAETFERAWKSGSQLIQIATWNDYGEGTVIEPTEEFGYRYLEIVQEHTQRQAKETTKFVPNDLRLALMLYELKKEQAHNSAAMQDLENARALLFSGECSAARVILERCAKKGD